MNDGRMYVISDLAADEFTRTGWHMLSGYLAVPFVLCTLLAVVLVAMAFPSVGKD